MAVKGALLHMNDGTGWHPVALLVVGENLPCSIAAKSAWAAVSSAEANRLRVALWGHDAPAPPQGMLGLFASALPSLAHRAIQRVVHVALRVKDRTVSILMIGPADAPAAAGAKVLVGAAIGVAVREACHLAALRGVERAIVEGQTKNLMQALGKSAPPQIGRSRRLCRGLGEDPHFATACGHSQSAIGKGSQPTNLNDGICGGLQRQGAVIRLVGHWGELRPQTIDSKEKQQTGPYHEMTSVMGLGESAARRLRCRPRPSGVGAQCSSRLRPDSSVKRKLGWPFSSRR